MSASAKLMSIEISPRAYSSGVIGSLEAYRSEASAGTSAFHPLLPSAVRGA
jgi:hypothetical protein